MYIMVNMGAIKNLRNCTLAAVFALVSALCAQSLTSFQTQWTGLDDLTSPSFSYQNRNISIMISEGGDRDGHSIYTSSCDFLFNDDLNWAYHYVGFDKESNKITFLRRFMTPLGVLGYEEMVYDLIDWSENYFHAEYISDNSDTYHQMRMFSSQLGVVNLHPEEIHLSQNFPNPFNPSTVIDVSVKKQTTGALIISDINGHEIKILKMGEFLPGNNRFLWNAEDSKGMPVAAGVYFYSLFLNGNFVQSHRMTLIK